MSDIPNLVLVEGTDDVHLLVHFLSQHGFSPDGEPKKWVVKREATGQRVELKPKNGFEVLACDLTTELFPAFLQRVAIIVDADASAAGRWQRLADILEAARADCGDLDVHGGVTVSERLVLGVWIMPDNAQSGYSEHFLASLIRVDDTLWPRAQQAVASIPPTERRFSDVRIRKAEIHTWLAWQEEPGTRTGQAITSRYLDVTKPPALDFVAWFNRWLDTPAPTA